MSFLDQAATPDGGSLSLHEREGAFVIALDGEELMHSRAAASETLLGDIGVADLEPDVASRVLIGGLGLGFTLRSVLDSTGPDTAVEVVELMPAVVEWNRTHLKALNGALLEDPRVIVRVQDVARSIGMAKPQTYDSILLDVDNGPFAMVAPGNASLYSDTGIERICRALKPTGRAFIWSAVREPGFENRLTEARTKFEVIEAKAHESLSENGRGAELERGGMGSEDARSAAHWIYVLQPA